MKLKKYLNAGISFDGGVIKPRITGRDSCNSSKNEEKCSKHVQYSIVFVTRQLSKKATRVAVRVVEHLKKDFKNLFRPNACRGSCVRYLVDFTVHLVSQLINTNVYSDLQGSGQYWPWKN